MAAAQPRSPGWNDLPAELQLQVLALLPGVMLPTLRLVAADWRALADDPQLRSKFHLVTDAGMTPDDIQALVAGKKDLLTLTMKDHQLSQPLLQAMLEHSSLATIHLQETAITNTTHFSVVFQTLYQPIFERRLAAAWLGTRSGGMGGRPLGATWKTRPALFLCAKKGSEAFRAMEHTYKILKFK
jgi:hypothetical protein